MSVWDAAIHLKVSPGEVERMIRLGKIALDASEGSRQVLVLVDPNHEPKYVPAVPPIRQAFQAVQVSLAHCEPDDLAGRILEEFRGMGFAVREGTRATFITPTEELAVRDVPEIERRLRDLAGAAKVVIGFRGYRLRTDDRLL